MKGHLIALLVGAALDLLFGDPLGGFHIVVWIGQLIAALERVLRGLLPESERGERLGGALLVGVICALSVGGSAGALALGYGLHPALGLSIDAFLCWQCLAATALKRESMRVYRCIQARDLEAARRAVGRIVGRDTAALDESGVLRAGVETVAENASDGVVAPLFYLLLGGAPLGVLYKAVNTMDSMLGYKNERYLHFGRAAAKTDDAANFLPARLCGVLMILAAGLCGYDAANAARIFRRDRFNHASPNSAQTEAACAGALHLQLGGSASYFGKSVAKPTIGDADRPIEPEDIPRANRLMLCSAALLLVPGALLRGWLLLC